jgi:UDP-N-acetylmuramate: L-alanyl-gamma-D-glutamyl-meso-diaminopimelate ligase
MSHVHILGIGGTFMAGVAVLAQAAGHRVSGQDGPLYPPMSEVLADAGIALSTTDDLSPEADQADSIIIGNALSRGYPAVEAVLERRLRYTSGPAWLAEHVLKDRWVIAIAGTHGKTTTASLVAWLLEAAGLEPGFLIGGQPGNFQSSARLGKPPFFVIEADEYDTAFFDKRSKFIHFHPDTLVLNNLEFDHADIFTDLAAIEQQFQHLIRTVPGNGGIVVNADDLALTRVLEQGCWSRLIPFGLQADGPGALTPATPHWQLGDTPFTPPLPGVHNAKNTAAAILAVRDAGVPLAASVPALSDFAGIRRRLERVGGSNGISVFDDFAHHPTAIAATLAALGEKAKRGRLIAVLEPRSNTMRAGVHAATLAPALQAADRVYMLVTPHLDWDVSAALAPLGARANTATTVTDLIAAISDWARPGDRIVVMSNGAFEGIHGRLLDALAKREHSY